MIPFLIGLIEVSDVMIHSVNRSDVCWDGFDATLPRRAWLVGLAENNTRLHARHAKCSDIMFLIN